MQSSFWGDCGGIIEGGGLVVVVVHLVVLAVVLGGIHWVVGCLVVHIVVEDGVVIVGLVVVVVHICVVVEAVVMLVPSVWHCACEGQSQVLLNLFQ